MSIVTISVLAMTSWAVASNRTTGGNPRGHEYGVQFAPKVSGVIEGVVFYHERDTGADLTATLWSTDGALLARAEHSRTVGGGWHRADFSKPVTVDSGVSYVVSYWSLSKKPTTDSDFLRPPPPGKSNQIEVEASFIGKIRGFPHREVRAHRDLVHPIFRPITTSHGSTVPAQPTPTGSASPSPTNSPTTTGSTPTSSPPPSNSSTPVATIPSPTSGFPNASNTGVPSGTSLTSYGESCTITRASAVIDGKKLDCDVVIRAPGVVIRNSLITGTLDSDTDNASVTIEDSEIDGGTAYRATVGQRNITIRRANIHGGQHSVQCSANCVIQDSWLHGQYIPSNGDWHLNAFISNGGTNLTLTHNTLSCDAKVTPIDGGCTADASIFGDFEPNSNITFDRNLFVASTDLSYCTYGGYDPRKPYGTSVSNIVYTNNVFQRGTNGKCGQYGPLTAFNTSQPGNVWRNNVWDDGTPLPVG